MTLSELTHGDHFYVAAKKWNIYIFATMVLSKNGTPRRARCILPGKITPVYIRHDEAIVKISSNPKNN
jgi:hypothetical protein